MFSSTKHQLPIWNWSEELAVENIVACKGRQKVFMAAIFAFHAGKVVVQFVALIYLSYVSKAMSDNQLFKSYILKELLDEPDVIKSFEQLERKHRIGEMTKKQMCLY